MEHTVNVYHEKIEKVYNVFWKWIVYLNQYTMVIYVYPKVKAFCTCALNRTICYQDFGVRKNKICFTKH